MGKELLEMTLEELWGLFPIFLVQHDNQWNEYYNEIESTITDLLAGYGCCRRNHRLHCFAKKQIQVGGY